MNAVLAICLLEIRLGVRNQWVVMASLILLIFAVVLVLIGATPSAGLDTDAVSLLVASLTTLSVYLLPLIALLLSFDSIAGEIDRGTLQLILATPISRSQLLIGKFFGHLVVLSIAVCVGYGLAGVLAFATTESASLDSLFALLRLILTSILLGAAFIGIGLVLSSSVRQSSTAAAAAIGLWLFSVVLYDLAILGWLVLSPEGVFARKLMPYALVVNPADAFRVYNMHMLSVGGNATGLASDGATLPFSSSLAILSPPLVVVLSLLIAATILRRIDP